MRAVLYVLGHMTKVASLSIYGKITFFFSRSTGPMILEIVKKHFGTWPIIFSVNVIIQETNIKIHTFPNERKHDAYNVHFSHYSLY